MINLGIKTFEKYRALKSFLKYENSGIVGDAIEILTTKLLLLLYYPIVSTDIRPAFYKP